MLTMSSISSIALFCRAVLGLVFALLELLNLLLNSLVYPTLQFRTVAELEENLEPDKERGQEYSLDEIVQQSWRPSLKLSVSNKLRNPACNVDRASPGVDGHAVLRCKMVRIRSTADQYRSNHGSCDGLHQDVQGRVEHGCSSADVEREIGHGKP